MEIIPSTMEFTPLDNYIAYASPVLYMLFVEICKVVLPRENEKNKSTIEFVRMLHNLGLCLASLGMFIGVCMFGFEGGRTSIHGALCFRFRNEHIAHWIGYLFYLSKYWEWIDTAFLIIGNKKVSWLQYTHHMSTAILVYVNITPIVSSASLLASFTNCFVHIFMYYYFAFPRGFMRKYRQAITVIQLIQHVACLSGWTYIYLHIDQCYSTVLGIQLALGLYVMYLTFFSIFYFVQYVRGGSTAKPKPQKKVE